MAKLDAYLRSIERFGAAGVVLTSNQAVTLRFPTGDRHATQVTSHDQLVGLVREVAPPAALDQIDKHRPARFEHDSLGHHYGISVVPRPGAWQVTIEAMGVSTAQTQVIPTMTPGTAPPFARPAANVVPLQGELLIERGQYDPPANATATRGTASGSGILDEITHAARAVRATDVYLGTGVAPVQRIEHQLVQIGGAIDGEQLARELGLVAPPEARARWSETGTATFAYGDGAGRVRAMLARDQRGPCAALRLLPDDPPRLELPLDEWVQRSGLLLVAGPSGMGKTVTLAAIVRALAERKRRVITVEEPIEIVHPSPWVSQRGVGPHVASIAAGVAAAMLENTDAIAISSIGTSAAANALVDAVLGGHFVAATLVAPGAGMAMELVLDFVPAERRDLARGILSSALIATVVPVLGRTGRSFEIARAGVDRPR
jgi:twitching motility protein PilT